MAKLNSSAELEKKREQILSHRDPKKPCVTICSGTGCHALDSDKVAEAFASEISKNSLSTKVDVRRTGCHGFCERGPVVVIFPEGTCYLGMKPTDVPDVVSQTLVGKQLVERLLYKDSAGKSIAHEGDIPFYKFQSRIVFSNNTRIDPKRIDDYIALGGYSALDKALFKMSPEEVLGEVKKSNLRGRGGGGFPAGMKWEATRNAPGDTKYVVVNADEGDPGAFMDRSLLEGNPHSVLEGLIIGAYAIGSHHGYIYVRQEYPLAVENVGIALKQAEEYGLLGKNILGSKFDFDITVHRGAGAFVCGEETALLHSLEGKPGEPRPRPPYPAVKGLFDKPTNLNNVETWANVPLIIDRGSDFFASIGTKGSKGTKIFALVGKVNNTGLVEVPMGITLGDIIYNVGGGIRGGKKFKAVQIGGPSGGCIPKEHLNIIVDFDELPKVGAIMGSGGMIVMDEDTCMVDIARYFVNFLSDESCGKCTACRESLRKMTRILNNIVEGRGKEGDIERLESLASVLNGASLCALGRTAANPVLNTLRHFRGEYEAHIIDKHCPAAVCQHLFKAPCQHTCPVELDCPGYVALVKEGKYAEAYKLIRQRLPFPMSVGRVCDHPCEVKCRRAQVDESISIRDLKRMAADYAYEHGVEFVPPMKPKKPERVAIIGAGPAGLTAAYELAREGYNVTLFEALPVAGGMMAVAIPEYRLPKKLLNAEIDNILKLGVELKLNTKVNDVNTLLKEGYKAVFISCGAHKGDKMGIPGEDVVGVYDAIDFLRELSLGKKPKVGKRVAVVGGGNSAIDAARSAVRQGAEEVHILYRRERRDMPAIDEEIEAALNEGIHIDCLVAPTKVLSENGKVTGLECVRMELKGFDASGRRTPSPLAGPEYTYPLPVDTVIEAIGQRPDTSFIRDGVKVTKGGTITADPRTLATDKPGVFAGGDAVTGPKTVIWAVAAGQRAATSIKRYLQGKPLSIFVERDGYEPIAIPQIAPTEQELKERARIQPPEIESNERRSSYKEIVLAFRPNEAREEASRCLRCDLEVEGEE